MEYLDQIYESVLKGKAPQTTELVQNAVAHGVPINGMISSMNRAMEEVGQRFSRNEIFLAGNDDSCSSNEIRHGNSGTSYRRAVDRN